MKRNEPRGRRAAPRSKACCLPWLARAAACLAWALAAWMATAAGPACATHANYNVLVLFTNGRLLPANIEADRGLRQGLAESQPQPAAVFDEFLDWPRFDSPESASIFADYLRRKYANEPPEVVVAVSWGALDFVLRNRARLFPKAALVHMGVPGEFLRAIPAPPAEMLGVALDFDFAGTAALALKLHPQVRHLVFVSGASPQDRAFEAEMRRAAELLGNRASMEFLEGLPEAQVLARLATLGPDNAVVTLGYFRDGLGRDFVPRESVRVMAGASGAPIYAPANTYLGTGAIGGIMPDYAALGRTAGRFVRQQVQGLPHVVPGPEAAVPMTLQLDWRQVQRWGIDERTIPDAAILHFRDPTLWQAHRGEVLVAAALFLLQSALIGLLVFERRRRQQAERFANGQRAEFAHASRLAIAGELTASIAHEINQPLGAILSNAETAELLLESGADRRDELRAILADIRRDDLRASEVIRRLRALLARHEVEREPIDLNDAVRDMASLIRAEIQRRGITLDVQLAPAPQIVLGDRIQIQQVLINLVLNAIDATAGLEEARCRIDVVVRGQVGGSRITVRDHGPGIAAADLAKIFHSFFSTKRKGMGLGLSIARTLVQAHGGRIWAENGADDGAVFQLDFPLAGTTLNTTRGHP